MNNGLIHFDKISPWATLNFVTALTNWSRMSRGASGQPVSAWNMQYLLIFPGAGSHVSAPEWLQNCNRVSDTCNLRHKPRKQLSKWREAACMVKTVHLWMGMGCHHCVLSQLYHSCINRKINKSNGKKEVCVHKLNGYLFSVWLTAARCVSSRNKLGWIYEYESVPKMLFVVALFLLHCFPLNRVW